jgi:hypothetical protein
VDVMLADLGLESCGNTRCGNQFIQGLSGGQKRRLSLALALVKQPAVLFLDELTSGLDSHAASEIMAVVRRVARAGSIVVICTIHQPSARVFNAFDSVMLLSGGRVAYAGPVATVSDYFAAACARAPPEDMTPAEFILEMVNSDFGGAEKQAQVAKLLSTWADRAGAMPAPPAVHGQGLPAAAGSSTPLAKQARPCARPPARPTEPPPRSRRRDLAYCRTHSSRRRAACAPNSTGRRCCLRCMQCMRARPNRAVRR